MTEMESRTGLVWTRPKWNEKFTEAIGHNGLPRYAIYGNSSRDWDLTVNIGRDPYVVPGHRTCAEAVEAADKIEEKERHDSTGHDRCIRCGDRARLVVTRLVRFRSPARPIPLCYAHLTNHIYLNLGERLTFEEAK